MAISKVIFNGVTQMDVTGDTVEEGNLLSGETATKNSGVRITGTFNPASIIDDTAGDGDTDKAWSADKITDELSEKYEKPSTGIPKTDLANAVQTSLGKADSSYQKPSGGIPASDLASGVIPDISGKVSGPSSATGNHVVIFDGTTGKSVKDSGYTIGKSVPSDAVFTDTTYESKQASSGGTAVSLVTTGEKYTWNNKGSYSKPSGGIPKTDLESAVQTSLDKADSAYQKSSSGIPSSDFASAVQTSLGKADTAYQKPNGGIPASDLASGVIPDVSGFYTKPNTGIPSTDLESAVQTSLGKADSAYQKPSSGIPASDLASGVIPDISGKANAESLAIVADGNTHIAIASGQYVYVKNHSTLSDGLYTAKSAIAANATLSTSNLQAETSGGFNSLSGQIVELSNIIAPIKISTKSSITTLTLTIPASSRRLLQVFFGNINAYWIGFVQGTSQQLIRVAEIYKGSSVTVSAPTSGSTITFTVSSSTTAEVYDMCYSGSFISV